MKNTFKIIVLLLLLYFIFIEKTKYETVNLILNYIYYISNMKEYRNIEKQGVQITLPKTKWVYIPNSNRETKLDIDFYGRAKIKNNAKHTEIRAFLISYENIFSDSMFLKFINKTLSDCDFVKTKEYMKDNKIYTKNICGLATKDDNGNKYLYSKVIVVQEDRKIKIEYFPYIENEKNDKILDEFLSGIYIK